MSEAHTILVVDDEEAITRTLKGVLEDEGYRTVLVGDGGEVLAALGEHDPDVVVLDIWLPGVDGIELLKQIKEASPDVEVVMISGHASIDTAVQSVRLGAFDFIEKPLSRDRLLLTLARATERRRLVRENRELRNQTSPAPVASAEPEASAGPSVLPGPPGPRPQPQRTIKRSVVLYGKGLHSGIKTGLILSPLPPGSGIRFGTVSSTETFPCHLDRVRSTGYATNLEASGLEARTVEHFLATLHSYGVTNLLFKMHGEVPIMDGSASDFCRILEEAGIEEQDEAIEPIRIQKRYVQGDEGPDGEYISIEPADEFSVRYILDYPPPVGRQDYTFRHRGGSSFREEIAPARTFGFVRDIRALEEMGLADGGRLTNVILIDDEKIVNTELRFPEELARHKILDVIGDLYLLGRPLLGHVTAQKTGHSDNVALLRQIQADLALAA